MIIGQVFSSLLVFKVQMAGKKAYCVACWFVSTKKEKAFTTQTFNDCMSRTRIISTEIIAEIILFCDHHTQKWLNIRLNVNISSE